MEESAKDQSTKDFVSIHTYKQKVKELEKERDNFRLLVVSLVIYLLFGTSYQAGKILISTSYGSAQHDFGSLANLQWAIYFIASPVGVQSLTFLMVRMKFKLILFMGALGAQLFLVPTLYATLCDMNQNWYCNAWLVYMFTLVVTALSGAMQGTLFFGMLFYLTNISSQEEKPIYYAGFYLIHNFCWMSSPLFGEIILYVFRNQAKFLDHYFETIMAVNFILSLLFFFIIEPVGETKLDRVIKQLQQQKKKSQSSSRSTIRGVEMLPLQQFSMDEQEILMSSSSQTSVNKFGSSDSIISQMQIISFDDYDGSYYHKLFRTWKDLHPMGFNYLVPLQFLVASSQAYFLIYLYQLVVVSGFNIADDQSIVEQSVNQMLFEIMQAFMYFGVGEILGCFAMAILGDFKDKIIGLMILISVTQVGLILGITICSVLDKRIFFLTCIFCSFLGFTDSAINTALISIAVYEYPFHVYMVDLLYLQYSIALAVSSAILTLCNYTSYKYGFLYMEAIVIASFISIYIYYRKNKQRGF